MPRAKKAAADVPLIDLAAPSGRGGPVYQGLNRTIRKLAADEGLDLDRHAATIAQARSLAASVDRASGHDGGRQASGMQLAALHERLAALVALLMPEQQEADPFAAFLDDLASTTEDAEHGDATAPHA